MDDTGLFHNKLNAQLRLDIFITYTDVIICQFSLWLFHRYLSKKDGDLHLKFEIFYNKTE